MLPACLLACRLAHVPAQCRRLDDACSMLDANSVLLQHDYLLPLLPTEDWETLRGERSLGVLGRDP